LDGGTISGDSLMMWLMLRFGGVLVAKACKCFLDVAGHAEMDVSFFIVPVESQSEIASAFPICVTSVILLEDFEEVFDIVLVDIFYPKVVND
jgi:hypothetical protein